MTTQNANVVFVQLMVCLFAATGVMACGEVDEPDNDNQANQQQNNDEQNDDEFADYDIEIAGAWTTDPGEGFEGTLTVTDDEWDDGFDVRDVVSFDNGENRVITQLPEDAEHNPETYSRTVWTEFGGDSFYYCEDAFGHDSEEDARGAESDADPDDLEGGCGDGHSWSEAVRQ